MHTYSAIPDIEPDSAAGIRTTAVWLGKKRALVFVGLNWLGAFFLALQQGGVWSLPLGLYPVLVLLQLQLKTSVEKWYWYFPIINASIGFYLWIALTYSLLAP